MQALGSVFGRQPSKQYVQETLANLFVSHFFFEENRAHRETISGLGQVTVGEKDGIEVVGWFVTIGGWGAGVPVTGDIEGDLVVGRSVGATVVGRLVGAAVGFNVFFLVGEWLVGAGVGIQCILSKLHEVVLQTRSQTLLS